MKSFPDCLKKATFLVIAVSAIALPVLAQSNATDATTAYFRAIQHHPKQLSEFLYRMPKGGDLHNHLAGAVLAENLLYYAKQDPLCVDAKTGEVKSDTACPFEHCLANIKAHSPLWESLIDQWSMRHYNVQHRLGHDHFFHTFDKFCPLVDSHMGEITREIVQRAALQNELYLELRVTPACLQISALAKKVGWHSDLLQMRERLLANGLSHIVADITHQLDQSEAKVYTNGKSVGDVKIRYLYQVLREASPEQVFAQLLVGFVLTSQDPRVVGVNMVQPEDGVLAMRDYSLHMKMVAFLRKMYPAVRVSLHAGELVPPLVSSKGSCFHMCEAVMTAHADRIGHGVDIRYEQNFEPLLNYMAKKHIMGEINLTSNEKILGIRGKMHPILLYLRYGLPIALSTDDEGVLRTNLTEEYKKLVLTYHFAYPLLKKLSRNSILYSFLPGNNLWIDDKYQQVVEACRHDKLGNEQPTATCQKFLEANEKARLQWELEKRFNIFEKHYVR